MRLNGEEFSLNIFKIEQIQAYPDTTITLMNGKKIVVKDEEKEVIERINLFYRQIGQQGNGIGVGGIE